MPMSSFMNPDDDMEVLQSFLQDPIANAGQTLAYMKSQPMSSMTHPPLSPTANILAASSYPQPIPLSSQRRPSEITNPQLYAGIVLQPMDDLDDSGTSSDVEPTPNVKKKTRGASNASNDDATSDTKRQRGRPRVDTRDETAADRRRTQIRLAQRAYRQRKETTISALKKRVADLERNIDQVSSLFLSFNDQIAASGLISGRRDLDQQLKAVAEQFVELSRLAVHDSDQDFDPNSIAEVSKGTGSARNSISEPHAQMDVDAVTPVSFKEKSHSMSAGQPGAMAAVRAASTKKLQNQSPHLMQQSPTIQQSLQPASAPQVAQRPRPLEDEMFFSFPPDFSWQNFSSYRMPYNHSATTQPMSRSLYDTADPDVAAQSTNIKGTPGAPL